MFFKKKKKFQPHIRFQRPEFKRQLREARGFRRVARPFDDSRASKMRSGFRRVSWTWVLPPVVALGLGVYLVFIPNFFYIREVKVQGTEGPLVETIRQEIFSYTERNRANFIPQANALFLDTKALTQFLLAADPNISEVRSIRKSYPHTVVVEIVPRLHSYSLESPAGRFLVSDDGVVMQAIGAPVSDTLHLVAVGFQNVSVGQRILSPELSQSLAALRDRLAQAQILVSSIELVPIMTIAAPDADGIRPAPAIADLPTRELLVFTTKGVTGSVGGFKILFSVGNHIDDAVARLQLLLSEQSKDRLGKLAYIDMRLNKRSFLCLVDSPCATVAPSLPAESGSGSN